MSNHVLDARRLLCPLPVIRLQDEVAKLAPGDTMEVHATDPGVHHDIPAWCRMYGHRVLGSEEHDGEIVIRIEVVES